jgi:fructose-bisphosphate aldolase class I
MIRTAQELVAPGIVFLSGGQSDGEATANLDELNRRALQPGELSFSFGRALQAPMLRAWAGDSTHGDAARAALLHRTALNGAARRGSYRAEMEQPVAAP